MYRYFLSIRGFYALAVALSALLLASGCGSSDEDGVSVQTGSLSKAEFTKRADAICEAARNQFVTEYSDFGRRNQLTAASLKAKLGELVDKIVLPNYEKRIDEISALGAPSADQEGVADFLNALQLRLEEMHAQPAKLSEKAFPFAKAAKLAKEAGLRGCGGSFG
jgi:hypothetical protein